VGQGGPGVSIDPRRLIRRAHQQRWRWARRIRRRTVRLRLGRLCPPYRCSGITRAFSWPLRPTSSVRKTARGAERCARA